MSTKDFTANVISATKVVPDGNFKDSKASGIWDINEALDLIKGGNWPNAANVNPAAFVDALFQTHLYTGTASSAQTITNNIDLTKGGLVWMKSRTGTDEHTLMDTAIGTGSYLISHSANQAAGTSNAYITSYNSNGFSIGAGNQINRSGEDFVSWTFRKQPKFFDIVTYTGNGSNQNISHNLGTTPGFVMVKETSGTGNWSCWHRSLDSDDYILLNTTGAAVAAGGSYNRTVNSTTYQVFGDYSDEGANAATYVMYLFAHNDDDGGFGEPGDQDIINCGSYTGNGNATGPVVNLGFEPQWLLVKDATSSNDWFIWDVMRGFPANVANSLVSLNPNTNDAEQAEYGTAPQPTGFQVTDNNAAINTNNNTYIYMAIRRGGMQTPTAASDVFNVATYSSNSDSNVFNTGFAADMAITTRTSGTNNYNLARLMGSYYLWTDGANAEANVGTQWYASNNSVDFDTSFWGTTSDTVTWSWKRARGFFDAVCYNGTGSARTVAHNLGVAPEMMWVKNRDNADDWAIYYGDNTDYLNLNDNGATADSDSRWNDTSPTSSVFTVGTDHSVNASGESYISYHFATLAGVSKVGSVSHSGSSTDVDCGFTSGASFVLLKRTDDTGSWLVFDSVRGIISGNSPYLKLQATAAEITSVNILNPLSSGFQIPDDQNDGDYIFYAIAAIS